MKTVIEKVIENQKICNQDKIDTAGKIIQEGGLVAFPTETVYGLGADALNPKASRKIYEAKGRPSDNPLIIHIADMKALDKIAVHISEKAVKLAEHFWPGPLTMIFEKSEAVPLETTGGLPDSGCPYAQSSSGIGADPGGRRLHCSAQCKYFWQAQSHISRTCGRRYGWTDSHDS